MEICIGTTVGEHVIIHILSKLNSEGWVMAGIDIHVGVWKGRIRADFRGEDFPSFRKQLQTMHDWKTNEATFSTMEEWLTLKLTMDHRGHVHIKGTAIDEPGIGNTLSFHLELDQSYLPQIISELKSAEGDMMG